MGQDVRIDFPAISAVDNRVLTWGCGQKNWRLTGNPHNQQAAVQPSIAL